MILIDIPQVAYKTWCIEYLVEMEDGTRDRLRERELEKDLERSLSKYSYSENNPHVR